MEKLRVFTAFSGYDSQCLALNRLKENNPDFDYELVGWSEIDKYAIQAHNALFPHRSDRNLGDISKIDWDGVPDFDLFTYSSPCQDFSNAGLQKGGEKGSGTRSSLLWECEKAIIAKRPKYCILENVKALVSKKFIDLFMNWCKVLEGYGYTNYWKVLNAKDYGVPQNRERVFLVSILNDGEFDFPEPMALDNKLASVLEPQVEDKYFLSDRTLAGFKEHNRIHQEKGTGFIWKTRDLDGVASTIRANSALCPTDNTVSVPVFEFPEPLPLNKRLKDILEDRVSEKYYLSEGMKTYIRADNEKWRGANGESLVNKSIASTINTGEGSRRCDASNYILKGAPENYDIKKDSLKLLEKASADCRSAKIEAMIKDERIRKLTPTECFRLMGVSDKDIQAIRTSGVSNSQQYKMAGNSIVVDVLYYIFEQLLIIGPLL